MSVLNRILPERMDNRYRGHRLAVWLFVPITAQRLAMSLTHLFKADGGAQSISTMPLDTYSPSAVQNVVGLFARMGLDQLVLGLLFVIVLLRYRAMIPLMYVLVVAHYLASKGVSYMKPLYLAGTSSASAPALVIALLAFSGLALSLLGRGCADPPMAPRDPQRWRKVRANRTVGRQAESDQNAKSAQAPAAFTCSACGILGVSSQQASARG